MRSTLISDLNITWLPDANVKGPMSWAPPVAWADNFSFGGCSDWRLPTSDQCLGYSCRSSEMAHLFFVKWGNIQGASTVNSGEFQNVQNAAYWSATTLVSNPSDSLFFYPTGGNQRSGTQNSKLFAMAARDGDVIATVRRSGARNLRGDAARPGRRRIRHKASRPRFVLNHLPLPWPFARLRLVASQVVR